MHFTTRPAVNIQHEHIHYREPCNNTAEHPHSKRSILFQKIESSTAKGLPSISLGASIALLATGMTAVGGACSLIAIGLFSSFKANIKRFNSTQVDAEKNLKDVFEIVFTPNTGTAFYAVRLKPDINPKTAAFHLYSRACPNIIGNTVTYERLINKINQELLQQVSQIQSPISPPNQARIPDEIVNAAAKAIRLGTKEYIGRSVAVKSVITFASFAVAGGLIGSAFPVIGTGFGALGGIGIRIANAFITYHNYQKDLKNIEEIVLNQLKNQQAIILG